jgi:trehalose-6-phosphatase
MLAACNVDVTRALAQATAAATLLVVVEAEALLDEAIDGAAREPRRREEVEALGLVALTPSTHGAVVSGRALADLQTATEWPEAIELIGSHGLEWSSLFSIGLSRTASARLHWLNRRVEGITPGEALLIERKPFGVSIHHRGADPKVVAQVFEAAQHLVGTNGEIYLRSTGAQIDLSVAPLTNGWAIEVLRQRLPPPVTTLYLGTGSDEPALTALEQQDVALLGSAIDGPDAMASLLQAVLVARCAS